MTGEEIGHLRDLQGFIEYCIRHDTSIGYCLSNLGHDIGILLKDPYDDSRPRTAGYAVQLKKDE